MEYILGEGFHPEIIKRGIEIIKFIGG